MSYVTVKDAAAATAYVKGTGAASSGDPFVPSHNIDSFVVPGTAATYLGKAEDAAHTTGDTGVFVLAVRNDTHTSALAGTDGDYTPIAVDSSGKVGIRGTFAEDAAHSSGDLGHFILAVHNATHTAALSGTDGDYTPIAVDSTGKVGIRGTYAEDAAHTDADLGVFILGRRIDTAASSAGTSGDYATVNTDSAGRLWARAQDDGPAWTSAFGVTSAAFTSADASGAAAAVTDAPTSAQKIVLTDLVVSVGSALTVTFTCETSGVVILKLYMAANSTVTVSPRSKIKLATADKKLMVQTSGAGNIGVTAAYTSEA